MPAPSAIARLNLSGDALTPGAPRSWWLREALAAEPGIACPPLIRDVNADVVIIGGGFTGLWTAYFLTETNTNLRIVVLEQDVCGSIRATDSATEPAVPTTAMSCCSGAPPALRWQSDGPRRS